MTYNLLDEPWIPVLWSSGDVNRVGIKQALTQAGRIRQIAASNPMDRVAFLRFLLALLYWCRGNPPTETAVTSDDSFPANWFSKLDENRDCFNLLGQGNRFYQDRDARRGRAVTDLLQEIPTGNNFWHFRHTTDKIDGLCAACCAMGLLRLPLFSVSGLPDLKAGINGTPPVYVVPYGKSLFETLLANWTPAASLGTPAWVQPDVCPSPGQDVHLLTGLTLLSRRVWLHEPGEPSGACISCGAQEPALIRTCEFQSAGEQKSERWNDPHVVYSDTTPRKASKAGDLTAAGKFRMDRPWTYLFAEMVRVGKFGRGDRPVALLVVGFATDQAKNIDVWERTIDVQAATTILPAAASLILQWQKEGGRLVPTLARALQLPNERKRSIKHVEIPPMLAAIRPHVEGKVSDRVGELLCGGDAAWEKAAQEYRQMMKTISQSVSPGFTTAAVQRRKQITDVLPEMGQETVPAKKPATGKRGAK